VVSKLSGELGEVVHAELMVVDGELVLESEMSGEVSMVTAAAGELACLLCLDRTEAMNLAMVVVMVVLVLILVPQLRESRVNDANLESKRRTEAGKVNTR
jgi:hypothetical protein